MATRALELPVSPRLGRASQAWIDGALMLAVALLLRCWWFGNPVVEVDEQFYLTVGDRMLHGAVPFVDIWDRKPVGLFLAYAGIRLLGGNGIVQYQLVATLMAAMAALLVVRIARLHASELASRLAGVAALIWLLVFGGEGGQAPILYGPFVAGAALLTVRAVLDTDLPSTSLFRRGCFAMLLVGIAMQIKYTAMFEGMGFGCLLLYAGWRRGQPLARLAGQAAAWGGLALLPTGLAFLWYELHGYGQAFVFANFVSIGERPPTPIHAILRRIGSTVLQAAPLIAGAIVAARQPSRDGAAARARRLLACWLVAAIVGALSIGTFFNHYFLPVLLPLAAFAAPALDEARSLGRQRLRFWPAGAVLGCGLALAGWNGIHHLRRRGSGEEVARMAAAIRPRLNGCLFVFDGEPILYYLTQACLATPYIFPSHLNAVREANAVGIDTVAETGRILASRPGIIVGSDRPDQGYDPATLALVRQALARDYRPILAVPVGHRVRIVYQRTD